MTLQEMRRGRKGRGPFLPWLRGKREAERSPCTLSRQGNHWGGGGRGDMLLSVQEKRESRTESVHLRNKLLCGYMSEVLQQEYAWRANRIFFLRSRFLFFTGAFVIDLLKQNDSPSPWKFLQSVVLTPQGCGLRQDLLFCKLETFPVPEKSLLAAWRWGT